MLFWHMKEHIGIMQGKKLGKYGVYGIVNANTNYNANISRYTINGKMDSQR